MSGAVIVVVVFLILYTIASAAFAFNLWNVSNRVARSYVGKPWWVRAIGRDDPNMYKAGGVIGVAFGVLVLGWIALEASR